MGSHSTDAASFLMPGEQYLHMKAANSFILCLQLMPAEQVAYLVEDWHCYHSHAINSTT